ncbi:MAG: hypothetical protein LBF68_01755 [Christensenellaceae bacterium]|jgi:hypothetical protein|nr:hypothetical protein [Christensenellaceae bacterium]
MKIFKNKPVFFSLIVILLVILGISSYFIFISIKREVSIMSFDERVVLSFGKGWVGKIKYDYHYKYVQFEVRDDELLSKIKNNEYIIASDLTDGYYRYLLAYKGYFFWISYTDSRDFVVIRNVFTRIFLDNTPELNAPFLIYETDVNFLSYEDQSNFINWDKFTFVSDFESLANLYAKLDDFYVREINKESNFIVLNCTQSVLDDITKNEDIGLKIICTNEGIDFEVVYFTNGN